MPELPAPSATPIVSEPARDPFAQLQTLPGPVRTFLLSPDRRRDLQNLHAAFSVSGDMLGKVVDIIGDIDLGFRKFTDLMPALTKELGWPEDRAKKFASDVAGYRYLPIADFLKLNVWAQIEAWGGDPKKYPVVKIEARKVTTTTLINEIIKESRLVLVPRMEGRIRHFLTSRVAGVRDDLEFKTMLTRADKVGGAELSDTDAERILGLLRLKIAGAQIVEEGTTPPSPTPPTESARAQKTPPPPPLPSTTRPVKDRPTIEETLPAAQRFLGPVTKTNEPETRAQKEPPKKTSALTILPEDEAEITTIKQAVRTVLKETGLQKPLDAATENIVRTSKLVFPSRELGNRFKSIVNSRLRDLRDAAETRALVMLPTNQSGLGLTPEQTSKLINLLDAEFLAIQKQTGVAKLQEKAAFEAAQTNTHEARAVEERRALQETLDRRYLETVKKSKALKERGVILPPSPLTANRLPTTAPVPTPKLSPASVPLMTGGKQKIEDVKFTRTVAGPVEELRAMTLVEFRRLSKDPKESTLKIHDRIELLKEQSFEKYVQGVRGWQDSEPNRLYLDLTRTALETGKPVPETIAERTTANQPALTLEEFQAILSLNSQLRF